MSFTNLYSFVEIIRSPSNTFTLTVDKNKVSEANKFAMVTVSVTDDAN